MAKVLIKINEQLFFTDVNVALFGKDSIFVRQTGLMTNTVQRASEIYAEHANGYFACIKNRSGDMYPLSPKEAFMWVLSATYFTAKEGIK